MRQQGTPTKYPGVQKIKDGLYRVRVKIKDQRTGKTKEVDQLVEGVSAQHAATVRTELLKQLQKQEDDKVEQRVRIGDFAKSWLASKVNVLDERTSRRYAEALDLHILPALGDLYYDVLRPADVQGWVNTELRQTKKGKRQRPYSVESVKGWFRVLRTMTRDAMGELDLPRDPTLRITFPDGEEPDDANALTPEELARFLEAMREKFPKNYALTATLAYTGLRFCHGSGLRWDDVDEMKGVIRIVRKNSRSKAGPVSRKKRAPREIPLVPELAAILTEHRVHLLKEQPRGLDEGWVFPSLLGTLRFAGSLGRAWRSCLKATGIKRRFTVHGLRRTFNDLARRAGVDAVVTRSITGHVTERMREHYSTVGLDEKHAAITGVVKLIPRSGVPATKVGTPVGTNPRTATLDGRHRA